jgi:hypothetical protein
MTESAIKAALEAAAWAECEARATVNECESKRCPRREPCQWCATGSAAAIAAFLRALPRLRVCTRSVCKFNGSALGDAADLAAAVERTAREGGG